MPPSSPPDEPAAAVATPAGRLRLRVAVFLAGACVMVLQILGTRIIGPHFGVGLFVWTALIAVTLAALAAGYWAGGILADRRPHPVSFAGVLLAAAAAVAVIPVIRGPVIECGWWFGLRVGALVAATLLFMPALTFLGMVSPYAIRLEAAGATAAGRSAGRLYAISTAGSVAGVLLAGFVLVPALGIPVLLAVIAATLAAAAVIAAMPGLHLRVATCAAAIAAVAAALAWPRPMPPGLVAVKAYEGSDIRVVDIDRDRYLFMDQAIQSSINHDGRSLAQHDYFMASRILLARPEARRAVVVGLGGGTLLPLLEKNGLGVECVELSPEVVELARRHFGVTLPAERLHVVDGRMFLDRRPACYDVVVLDAFGGDRIAATLVSREGFSIAKRALVRGGLLAVNTWGIDAIRGGPNAVGAAIRATLQQVFSDVLAVPAAGNLLFFASDEPIEPARAEILLETFDGPRSFRWLDVPPVDWPAAPVLTDDWNPVDALDLGGVEAFRSQRRRDFPAVIRAALAWE